MDILDEYVKSLPNHQNMVDLFKGEWSSRLPEVNEEHLVSGQAELFNDQRIALLNDHYPLLNKNILELGPLEAGHTYMMHGYGASEILAIEANSRAYLKCLLVKEMYHLNKAHFLLGDALEFMKSSSLHFDVLVASGILYHATSPAEFIANCSRLSDRVFVWTHYYDPIKINNYPSLQGKFSKIHELDYHGRNLKAWQFDYLSSLDWSGFCGGFNPYSLWIQKEDIFDLFKLNGLSRIKIFFDDETHPLGPNICFIAER